ncbi:MAG: hypothetical protein AB1715_05770, partial [Acidobacteriota bacterium]
VVHASRHLLGVHTVSGGRRLFKLPRPVEVVFDLFENRMVSAGASEFEVNLPRTSTSLFFTGEKKLLDSLGQKK